MKAFALWTSVFWAVLGGLVWLALGAVVLWNDYRAWKEGKASRLLGVVPCMCEACVAWRSLTRWQRFRSRLGSLIVRFGQWVDWDP